MKSVLIYTTNKAASMFIHKISKKISQLLDLDYYSMNGDHKQEIKRDGWSTVIDRYPMDGVFAPIRASRLDIYPENLNDFNVILHLRDPRDILVSKFFSSAYSHPIVEGGFNKSDEERQALREAGIDDFVSNMADKILREYQSFNDHLDDRGNVVLVKYETMVLQYDIWLRDFLAPFLSCTKDPKALYDQLYNLYKDDFHVDDEDIYQHKRRITPGDYRRKLKPETIEFLNDKLSKILNKLDYAI